MTKTTDKENLGLTRERAGQMAWCLGLSLFWAVFIWGFWEKGVFALGLNAFLFFSFALLLFIRAGYKRKYYDKSDLAWIIPLCLIAFSFLIYDNPFLKGFSLLVMPALAALFINYGNLTDKGKRHWDSNFVQHFISRILSFLTKINKAVNLYIALILPKGVKRGRVIAKIVLGLILFLLIAATLIIPLLSSADSVFAARIDFIYTWLSDILSTTFVYRSVVFLILALILLSALLGWGRKLDYSEKDESKKKIDPIVSGIVLGGILALYLLFLWVQLERLFVEGLPLDFKITESLVKSGFWQLFFLSGINVLIYFFTYRKTNKPVQQILTVFSVASLLLLISAGHRMVLYVINYGLSYEKFFASYTVLYSAILFIWLISRLFIKTRANIFKFVIFLFLWMFSVVTILPVEAIILNTNIALAQRPESRIRLFELTMLSPDVLNAVKKYKATSVLKESVDYLEREGEVKVKEQFDWQPWIDKQEKRIADKRWYEKNLMNMFNNTGINK